MKLKRPFFILAGGILVILMSLPSLYGRWTLENNHRSTAIVASYRDIEQLAMREDMDTGDVLERLEQAGIQAVMAGEFTGEEMRSGLSPAVYGPLYSFPEVKEQFAGAGDRAVVGIRSDWRHSDTAGKFLKARFRKTETVSSGIRTYYLLDSGVPYLENCGILPDLDGIYNISNSGLKVIYRPAPSGNLPADAVVSALNAVEGDLGPFYSLAPSGEVVAGYPDLGPIAAWVHEKDIPVAQVEFSRQVGAVKLNWRAFPDLLSMHSVTPEEILSRRISERTLHERMVRAAMERSVRLLVMRSSETDSTVSPLSDFENALIKLDNSLERGGLESEWPEPYPLRKNGLIPALALSLVLVLSLYAYVTMVWNMPVISYRGLFSVLCIWILLGGAVWMTSFGARVTGAFAAPFAAALATLIALENWERPLRGVLYGFLYALAAGLAIAAFFGTTYYMVRLKTFSGVKLTLLLPPLLVLFHDLKRRIHPESLSQILVRPALWGELVLIAFAGLAAVIILFRSGNVQFVPGWEIQIRDILERYLVARPRNKEIFAGYPFIFLWYLFRRKNIWPRYREVFRIGATLAFSTMVNSFCHFHTRLYFTLFREFNGLWAGILTGVLIVILFNFIVLPLWTRHRSVLME